MIPDKIVFGMSDLRTKECILREMDLDLAKAMEIYRVAKAICTQIQIQSMCKMLLEVNELHREITTIIIIIIIIQLCFFELTAPLSISHQIVILTIISAQH